jgi:hypothetical protein
MEYNELQVYVTEVFNKQRNFLHSLIVTFMEKHIISGPKAFFPTNIIFAEYQMRPSTPCNGPNNSSAHKSRRDLLPVQAARRTMAEQKYHKAFVVLAITRFIMKTPVIAIMVFTGYQH